MTNRSAEVYFFITLILLCQERCSVPWHLFRNKNRRQRKKDRITASPSPVLPENDLKKESTCLEPLLTPKTRVPLQVLLLVFFLLPSIPSSIWRETTVLWCLKYIWKHNVLVKHEWKWRFWTGEFQQQQNCAACRKPNVWEVRHYHPRSETSCPPHLQPSGLTGPMDALASWKEKLSRERTLRITCTFHIFKIQKTFVDFSIRKLSLKRKTKSRVVEFPPFLVSTHREQPCRI